MVGWDFNKIYTYMNIVLFEKGSRNWFNGNNGVEVDVKRQTAVFNKIKTVETVK